LPLTVLLTMTSSASFWMKIPPPLLGAEFRLIVEPMIRVCVLFWVKMPAPRWFVGPSPRSLMRLRSIVVRLIVSLASLLL
jgi:hypothetical protein